MSFVATALNVMIASPGDINEERLIVTEELQSWNDANAGARKIVLLPVKWETHTTPEMGDHPQSIINRHLLSEADILIAVFGTRIGTPTKEYVSGTVEEVRKQMASGKPTKLYFSDVPISPSTMNNDQHEAVKRFQTECRSLGLYSTYNTFDQFRKDFRRHIDIELNKARYLEIVSLKVSPRQQSTLSQDARELLKAAVDSDGTIISIRSLGGEVIQAGKQGFGDNTPRSTAKWAGALSELRTTGAVEQKSEDLDRVTAAGYGLVDDTGQHPASSPFDHDLASHTKSLLETLTYMHRDLLRFLLFKGGSARGDVIHLANTGTVPLDFNLFCRPLQENGLIRRVDNHVEGHPTLYVSEQLTDALKRLLFPRDEGNSTPFFKNIPLARS